LTAQKIAVAAVAAQIAEQQHFVAVVVAVKQTVVGRPRFSVTLFAPCVVVVQQTQPHSIAVFVAH